MAVEFDLPDPGQVGWHQSILGHGGDLDVLERVHRAVSMATVVVVHAHDYGRVSVRAVAYHVDH